MDVASRVRQFAHGDHVCLIYETFDEQIEAAVPYIESRLSQHDRCVYICDDRTAEQIRDALSGGGIDVAGEQARGALQIVTKREAYLRSGTFDPQAMIAFLGKLTDRAVSDGYRGLGVTGEMTWSLGGEPGCARLIEYEARLNDFLPGTRAVALCQYNRQRSAPATIRDVLRTHPAVVVGGWVYSPNVYYEPPGAVVGTVSESERVEWMLSQLHRVRDNEETMRAEGALRRRLEDELRRAQKLEALGRLAGGVAHDFNNLVTAILGYSDLLLRQIEPDHPLRSDLEEIRRAGDSAASLTGQLLAIGRRQATEPHALDLNAVITEMSRLLQRTLGEDARLVLRLQDGLQPVLADRGQIEQIVLNLAMNSRDAMPEGGDIVTDTRNVRVEGTLRIGGADVPPGDYVTLTVSDTGIGIDSETMERVYEPFFTTKPSGHGTGLGLATVYGLVQQNGGFIDIQSAVGKGTTVTVLFPATSETTSAPEGEPISADHAHESAAILLVEDDEAIRTIVARVLTAHGYTVRQARTGEEALALVGAGSVRFDLVVSDVVLPGIGGPEVVERLRSTRPALASLFISGYTEQRLQRLGVGARGARFLPKPFTPTMLLRAVGEAVALGRRAAADASDTSPR